MVLDRNRSAIRIPPLGQVVRQICDIPAVQFPVLRIDFVDEGSFRWREFVDFRLGSQGYFIVAQGGDVLAPDWIGAG